MTALETATAVATGVEGGKFLTFTLADEEYGIRILKVREIIGMQDITVVPQMPAFVRGVINLRGKVIQVIDLRVRFDMPSREADAQTCIIVTQIGETLIGVIVDAVREVLDLPCEQIEPPPTLGQGVETQFILGMGKSRERIIILLDIERILSAEQMAMINAAQSSLA